MPACRCCSRRSRRVGKIDRAAVIKEINTGTFDTIIGKVKLEDGLNKNIWAVGQWQGNDFFGIAPIAKEGAAPVMPSRRGSNKLVIPERARSAGLGIQDGSALPDWTSSEPATPIGWRRMTACTSLTRHRPLRAGARRHVCAHRTGAHAPVRRRAHHEPVVRRVPRRRGLRRALTSTAAWRSAR